MLALTALMTVPDMLGAKIDLLTHPLVATSHTALFSRRTAAYLEFLDIKDEYSETDLEEALIHHLADFLLELGTTLLSSEGSAA